MNSTEQDIISLKNLAVGYEGSDKLLDGVSVRIEQGELVALIGKNGSGKSTLLRTIAALKKPLSGELTIIGKPNNSIAIHELAKTLSFVGSGSAPVENLSVFELVSIGRHPYTNWWGSLDDSDKEKIMVAIGFVGMSDFLDVPVNRLSDGERQRVMIARALAQETGILLLDEPTAFLDLPNKFEIISLLHRLREAGKSIIYSTHDLETAFLFADKCWVINEHKILEGSVEDLGMQNVFSVLFKDTKAIFDEKEMKFIPERGKNGAIAMDIKDQKIASWTKRCLERVGLRLESTKEEYPLVSGQFNGDTFTWFVAFKGNRSEFDSLYDMARYLKQFK